MSKSPAFVESCSHCQNYTDGFGCGFHEARYAHEHNSEHQKEKTGHCFFCPPHPWNVEVIEE